MHNLHAIWNGTTSKNTSSPSGSVSSTSRPGRPLPQIPPAPYIPTDKHVPNVASHPASSDEPSVYNAIPPLVHPHSDLDPTSLPHLSAPLPLNIKKSRDSRQTFSERNILITGGTFTSTEHGDVHLHSHTMDWRPSGWDLLMQNIAPGAFHNSDERHEPPKCHPNTRQAVLKNIMDWVLTPVIWSTFIWLYGPAGAGKSAIAQTIAEMCERAGVLAATFFFSRTAPRRNDKTHLIPTLAYQLSLSIPAIKDSVVAAIERDPLIFSRALSTQMQTLVVTPLNDLVVADAGNPQACKIRPQIVILDGLDECGLADSQQQILKVLVESVHQLGPCFRFLVASRSEQPIRDAFNTGNLSSMTRGLPLDVLYKADEDIKTFLQSKFDDIKKTHPLTRYLPSTWPGERDMKRLVSKADGQFIYASTVMKYIESPRHRPTERLDIVLGVLQTSPSANDSPFSLLDALYGYILSSVHDIEKVLELLGLMLIYNSSGTVGFYSPYQVTLRLAEDLFAYKEGDVQLILSDLYAVIHMPRHDGDDWRFHHASFGDFLLDHSRSGRFFIDLGKAHARLARCWIDFVKQRRVLRHFQNFTAQEKDSILFRYMWHCSNAHLTQELVDALCAFDLDAHLTEITREKYTEFIRLRQFLDWLQEEIKICFDLS
ncbi:hypothetical protein BDZ97DRAFT_1212741 [Flammula alnicola]|nr:hypothetical protein BDZ97DRAFT_1212741 [Flammula alnicola]